MMSSIFSACATTSHYHVAAKLGKPVSALEMESLLDRPGPIHLETIPSANWSVDLDQILDLDDPKAKQAHLENHPEAIQIYLHIFTHPEHGTFLIDTGVSKKLADDPSGAGVGWAMRGALHLDKLQLLKGTREALDERKIKQIDGIFFTHLHLDHIAGLPDIPSPVEVPLFVGFGEVEESHWYNAFSQGTVDRIFDGKEPLQEFYFSDDPSGRFFGIIDLFGDGSVFAIRSPGHTEGSLAFVLRTVNGSVLLTGDTCHTRWGWDHGVEPGESTTDREEMRRSFAALQALASRHPSMQVRLGHEP